MIDFFKRLFRSKTPVDDGRREIVPRSSSNRVSDSYFATMSQMREAISKRDF